MFPRFPQLGISLSCRLGFDRGQLAVDAADPWGRRLIDTPITAATRSALMWDAILSRAALTDVCEAHLGQELAEFRSRGGTKILNLTGSPTRPGVLRAAAAVGVSIISAVDADRALEVDAVSLIRLPHETVGESDGWGTPSHCTMERLAAGTGPVVIASELPIRVPIASVRRLVDGGVAPDRIVVTGIGATDEFPVVRDLLSRGVTCVIDGFGAEVRWERLGLPIGPREPMLARWIVELFGMGLGSRLAVGHASWTSLDRRSLGGTGLSHLLRQVPRRLRDLGLTLGQLHQLLWENPNRVLGGDA